MITKEKIIERFISYVKIDTQSDPKSETTPSTEKQWDLANKLVEELKSFEKVLKEMKNDLDESGKVNTDLSERIIQKTEEVISLQQKNEVSNSKFEQIDSEIKKLKTELDQFLNEVTDYDIVDQIEKKFNFNSI